MARITIGIPCFGDVSQEVYEDHMRFMYYLGRRYAEHDFFLAVKMKSEQFRARTSIVKAALQMDCEYCLMLDDDMITNPDMTTTPTAHYDFLERLLEHMEEDPKLGIVGALYFQRGGNCFPVMLCEEKTEKTSYRFLRHDEIQWKLQEVAVAGGGCLLLRMAMFDKLPEPYFAPEHEYGTDVQICSKATAVGYKVAVDSSIILGHVVNTRGVVTEKNRHRFMAEDRERSFSDFESHDWYTAKPLAEYARDVVEYLGLPIDTIRERAFLYPDKNFPDFSPTPEYYIGLGIDQLCRQVCYHHTQYAREILEFTARMFKVNKNMKVLDFACGSGPVGYLLAKSNKVDFVDLNGASGFEFLKWRLKKNGINGSTCVDSRVFMANQPPDDYYDVILLMDALEHFENWEEIIAMCARLLKPQSPLVTNYFTMGDDPNNVEHVSMDREAAKAVFLKHNVQMVNNLVLVKNFRVEGS